MLLEHGVASANVARMTQFFDFVNVLDILAVIGVLVCVFQGVRQGLSKELARMVAALLALGLGIYTAIPLGAYAEAHTRLDAVNGRALAFTLVSILVLTVFLLLRIVFRIIMKISFNEKIEKPGGGLGGLVRGAAIIMTVFLVLNLWPNGYLNRRCGAESVVGSWSIRAANYLRPGLCVQRAREDTAAVKPATAKADDSAAGADAGTNNVPARPRR